MLILASASPRRRELLTWLGAEFSVKSSGADEVLDGGPLAEAVERLALRKAQAVAAEATHATVLGADTVVVIDGRVLGKPADAAEARRMLTRLRGRLHEVLTGVAIVHAGHWRTVSAVSRVVMASYGDDVIDAYVESGEPFDKAGAYAIQGLGGDLIVGLIGSYSNVVGLPLVETRRLLQLFGVPLRPAAASGSLA